MIKKDNNINKNHDVAVFWSVCRYTTIISSYTIL